MIHNPDGWSLDGDTIKDTRDNAYLPLFRVEPLTDRETVLVALAAPAMLAALKWARDALKVQAGRGNVPHADVKWLSAVIDSAEGR